MDKQAVGVLGATGLVGTCILRQLILGDYQIVAFSRKPAQHHHRQIRWEALNTNHGKHTHNELAQWISAAPIWVLPEYFSLLLAYGVQRIIILSSTSRFGKETSDDPGEQSIVQRITAAENIIEIWAKKHGIEWIILRPTLVYGLGQDKNITEIARFILRFHCFPLLGPAQGLRQPIHAQDVSTACILALNTLNIRNCTYNLTGGETLTYRKMVQRIFSALNKKPLFIKIPRWIFQLAMPVLNRLPRYKHWTVAMADRMNQDLAFESLDIQRDLHFTPKPFNLLAEDLPTKHHRC